VVKQLQDGQTHFIAYDLIKIYMEQPTTRAITEEMRKLDLYSSLHNHCLEGS